MARPETLTRTPGGEVIETTELTADWDEAIRLLRTSGLRFMACSWMILANAVAGAMWMTPAEVLERFDGCTACGRPGPVSTGSGRHLYRMSGRLVCGPCLDSDCA